MSLFINSCKKKWKEPTDVNFEFKLNENSDNGLVKFTDCKINLTKLSFLGERKQGESPVDFEQNLGNQEIEFNLNESNSDIVFQIPQGSYSKINIGLFLDTISDVAAIQLNGIYIDLEGDTIPVIFKLSIKDMFEMQALNSTGSKEINLVSEIPTNVSIVFNPMYWFANISQSQLEEASLNLVNEEGEDGEVDVPSIVIDLENENDLYNLIVNRIAEGNEVIFD